MSRHHIPLPVRAEALRLRREERLSSRTIAKRLKVDPATVRRWLSAAGLQWPDGGVVGRTATPVPQVPLCEVHRIELAGRYRRCVVCGWTAHPPLPQEWKPPEPPEWVRRQREFGRDRELKIPQPCWQFSPARE